MNNEGVSFHMLTPLSFLKRSAYTFPDKEAVVYEGTRYTYRQFYQRVMRMANGLKRLGIAKGDKVAFISPNLPALLEAHYAVPWIGAVLVTINIRLSQGEISYIVNHSEAKALFLDTEFAPAVGEIRDELKNVRTFVNIVDMPAEIGLEGPDYEAFLS